MSSKPTKQEDWKTRLLEELKELHSKIVKLSNFMDDENAKLSRKEWTILERQYRTMHEYQCALLERCSYYGLIKDERDEYLRY